MSILPKKPRIVAMVGPTASGKTALSILIAKRFDGEIVSADSRQVYRGMDVGTAKPTQEEMGSIPHYLIDIKDPDEDYTVAEYKNDAIAAISKILKNGRLPILAGGTGLYVKTVLENLNIPKTKADPELRKKIEKDIEENGLDAVFKQLVELDSEAAYIVDPKNPRRVVRALEVAILTGVPFTAQRKKNEPFFKPLKIGINPPPEVLRERINIRIDQMMNDGLLEEVKMLVTKYGDGQIAFDAIGYREIIDHLNGKLSLEESVAAMKINTWHYAKRQMTWFRKDKEINWIAIKEEAIKLVEQFLK